MKKVGVEDLNGTIISPLKSSPDADALDSRSGDTGPCLDAVHRLMHPLPASTIQSHDRHIVRNNK